ncbi:hypothetical protein QFZ57_000450 [Arthrobacter sp. B1I2]|nr:hypothetical protein [Arthrobacter sp. B1I2]
MAAALPLSSLPVSTLPRRGMEKYMAGCRRRAIRPYAEKELKRGHGGTDNGKVPAGRP